jgi:hypothetical protein
MTNQEKIREEIRVVLNRILDEEYESVLKMLKEEDLWLPSSDLNEGDIGQNNELAPKN